MTQASVSDPLSNLVDAIEEHAQRQLALIDCVRTLREFLSPVSPSAGASETLSPQLTSAPLPTFEAPPPPPPVQMAPLAQRTFEAPPPPPPPVQMAPLAQRTFEAPPPPPPPVEMPPLAQPTFEAPPPPPPPVQMAPLGQPTVPAVPPESSSPPDVFLRALKRDYNYFTELDERLAQLGEDLSTSEVEGVDRWTEASSN
jgi:hypothetical protein